MTTGHRTRRLQAVASAYELLTDVGIDPTRQVDVFRLCEQLGLWLAFLPLDRLLGAFIREGAGGVLITSERPVTVQRYTAAHELGHWKLGHKTTHVFDDESQVFGATSDDENESLAQVFAAALLMPPPLVFDTLERLGGVADDVSEVDAYTVAREAGVSYEAAVRQLANLEIISRDRLSELLDTAPLEIKTRIGRGQRPVTGHADVWPVDEDWHGHRLDVHIDDEAVIFLPENRTTGYRWVFAGYETQRPRTPEPPPLDEASSLAVSDSLMRQELFPDRTNKFDRQAVVADPARDILPNDVATSLVPRTTVELGNGAVVVGDRYFTSRSSIVSDHAPTHPPDPALFTDSSLRRLSLPDRVPESPVVGGSGQRVLAVRFRRPGPVDLRLSYRSSYDDAGPAEEYALTAHVEPRRYGISLKQLEASTEHNFSIPVAQRQAAPITPEPDSRIDKSLP